MIELSNVSWIKAENISSCEIFKKDDDCHYVKWFTSDGEILSDAHTGIIAARNYVKGIDKQITDSEKELDET